MPERPVPGYPPGIQDLFDVLWQEVCAFSAKWRLYADLFAKADDRAVINATAPGAFKLIESSLRNDLVMLIGRLTERPETGSKHNLSMERLIRGLEPDCPADLYARLEADLAAIRGHVKPFTEIRNRQIGHTDLATALSPVPDPALAVSRSHVDRALEMMSDLMNGISRHFADTDSWFRHVEMHGNGEHLHFYLRAGLDRCEENDRRARAGG